MCSTSKSMYHTDPIRDTVPWCGTYVHTYIHTYVHTYIHTHIHTYIRTYIHTLGSLGILFVWPSRPAAAAVQRMGSTHLLLRYCLRCCISHLAAPVWVCNTLYTILEEAVHTINTSPECVADIYSNIVCKTLIQIRVSDTTQHGIWKTTLYQYVSVLSVELSVLQYPL